MKKKALSLFLSVLLILGAVVPFTLANGVDGDHSSSSFELAGGETCLACGETGSHSASCPTRCSCGENKPASNHLFACELFTCGLCGAYLTQTGGVHNANCRASVESRAIAPEACGECGMTGGTHSEGCSAAQVAPVASVPCAVCGMTDGHTLTCSTLCSCGATGEEHQSTCKLYECVDCGRMINQEGHEIYCPTRCNCGDQKPDDGTHLGGCPLYKCSVCSVFPNQGYAHDMDCEFYACPVCGVLVWQPDTVLTDGCICHYASMYLGYDAVEENTYIAFPDKSQANLTMFNSTVEEFGYEYGIGSVPSSAFPDYVIINRQYYMDGQLKFYELDSFSAEFYDNTLGYYYYMEPRFFSAVVPAAGLYATVGGAERIDLFVTPGIATDGFDTVDASALGEYVVADFSYKYCEIENSYVKLTPDANWPEDVDANCCWVKAENITKLSLTPAQPPVPDAEHGEGCGEDCTVEGCTCACHNALLQRFYTATTLEELDDMMQAATEEEWSSFPEEAWAFLDVFSATLPTIYQIYGVTVYDPPVESEVCWPTKNFTNAAGIGAPVAGR